MPKDTFYFSHDYNARNDEKIKRLIRKHGMGGYGIFWSIIEDLYNNANALRLDYEGIAYDLRSDTDVVTSVINDFDLFIFDNEFFGSNSVQERLNQRNTKSESARKSASYRWGNANAMQTESDSNAIKERKGKEIKGKESKKEYRYNIFLQENENEKLIQEYGVDFTEKCYDYLSSYKVEKNYKTKSDYLTIKRWVLDAVKKLLPKQQNIVGNKYEQDLENARKNYKIISQ
jgi:hypothetical protein